MNVVAPLSAFDRTDLASAGGKGANLGELLSAGFPVPAGFVVTTAGYMAAASAVDLRLAERLEAGDATAIRADLEGVPVAGSLRDAVSRAYADLGRGPVAVRSSATAEDLPGAAFAGQQDTYLNVLGEDALIDAVRRCWASLWTDRAVAYRRRRGIDPGEVSIAVVVQRMVEAEVAGVMFTADPVTGDRRRIVVDASSGLGEAVVSGRVTPDHYLLDARGRVRDFTPGRREVVIRGAAGGGVTEEPADDTRPERLPTPVLRELARVGTAVARHFGRPQDIEWAYAGGRLFLLQARPMTALPPPPVRLNPVQRRIGSVLTEYLPVRPYPIDMSTWLPYGPAGLMAEVTEYFGIHGPFRNFLVEEDEVAYRLLPRAPHPTPAVVRGAFRILSLARRYDPARWTGDPRFADFLAGVDRLAARDPSTLPWRELTGLPHRALALIRPVIGLRRDYLPGSGLALLRLLLLLTRLGRRALFGDLILGARTRTTDANHALEHLAALVRSNPSLKDVVERRDLNALDRFPDFHAAFTAFLREYGHRETTTPLLVTPPTWTDAPDVVLGLLSVLVTEPPPDAGRRSEAALVELLGHPRLRSARRRAHAVRVVQAARDGVAFREDSHFAFTRPLPLLRRALLAIGERLAGAGVLDRTEDVFHFRLEELTAIPEPSELSGAERERLRRMVHRRAARRDELSGVRLIDPRAVFPVRDHGDALVSGTPASSGEITGPARVVREPAEFGRLRDGDVLVCPYTNPSWTPLFQRAAAVVVDSGGSASHAAIVAREYGIPAVMGTATGTTVLTDGLLVTVDGHSGRVTAAADVSQTAGAR